MIDRVFKVLQRKTNTLMGLRKLTVHKQDSLVWLLIGIISAPALFFIFSHSEIVGGPYRDEHLISKLFYYFFIFGIALYSFRKAIKVARNPPLWEIAKHDRWKTIRNILLLEVAAYLTWDVDDVGEELLVLFGQSLNVPIQLTSFSDYNLTSLELLYCVSMVLFAPLGFFLAKNYVVFFGQVCAALVDVYSSTSLGPQSSEASSHVVNGSSLSSLDDVFASSVAGAETRILIALLSITVVLSTAILSFVVVFQDSPTARALGNLDRIEASKFLLSSDLEGRIRTVERRLTDEIDQLQEIQSRKSEETEPPVIVLEDGTTEVVVYRNAVEQLQAFRSELSTMGSGVDNEIELRNLLERFQSIREEVRASDVTNWDLIVVRSAIVLLSLFILRALYKVYELAIIERRRWEERRAALRLASANGTARFSIDDYITLTRNNGREKKGETELEEKIINRILNRVADRSTED